MDTVRRPPAAVMATAVLWVVFAVLTAVAGLRGDDAATVDGGTAEEINASAGRDMVSSTTGGPWGVLLVVVALGLLAGVVALLLRQGWARQALVVLGVVAVIVLALAARWETVPVMVLLVLASAVSLVPSAHRWLRRPAKDLERAA